MTEIPDKMFQNNTSLKKVIVPASVTKVGSYAFSSSKIEEIYFEDSANGLTVGTFAFYNCPNLTSLRLPYGLTSSAPTPFPRPAWRPLSFPTPSPRWAGQRTGLQRQSEECHPVQEHDRRPQPRLCGLRSSGRS